MRKTLLLMLVPLLAVAAADGSGATASPIPMPPELWLMNADGTNQRAIYPTDGSGGWRYVADHDWSPDGTEIAFIGDGSLLIYSVQAGTTRTVVAAPYANYVDWSPTGEWIAFAAHSGTPRGLFVVRPDGSDLRHIGPDGQAVEPTWSPDGTRAAATYFYAPDRNVELTIVSLSGGSEVVASDLSFTAASWSPDGTQLAYSDTSQRLSVVNADGSIVKITASNSSYSVDWSPDGARIAYARGDGVFAIEPDGSGQIRLMAAGDSPRWDPTGATLAVHLGDDILRVSSDGSGQTNLTNEPDRYDSDPEWSPDATQISYVSSEKPYIPPDETIALAVTLRAREHLILKGRVQQEGREYSSCTQIGVKVFLQRRKDGGWVTLRRLTPRSDGRFEAEVPDRLGRYRALAPRTTGYGMGGNKITCTRARSTAIAHRH